MPVEPAEPVEPLEAPASTAIPLTQPREGVPQVVETTQALAAVCAAIAEGSGPVAVDAERASGYRYGQRAYLVQLRREGSGSHLIDPIAVPDLTSLTEAIGDAEWILHAASQDLGCLAEVGLVPAKLFDTELAARLTNHVRVGLGPLIEETLGFALEKGHSAADWSTRPLPEPWLRYAALDVELLVELREVLVRELEEQGKTEWAEEEFAAAMSAPPAAPRVDPWRRTSGVHKVRTRRQLAIVKELWQARDARGRARDIAPGRVLPDAAILSAAVATPKSVEALLALPGYSGRGTRKAIDIWWAAIERALALDENDLPPRTGPPGDGPPPAARWPERDPAAASRLAALREVIAALSEEWAVPAENLLQPDALRRLAWTPPAPVTTESVAAVLASHGARRWQIGLVAERFAVALTTAAD
ncbi:MAG: ribonuclease [Frankiales bacterium]|nr:ribonuclease [Frankiales bacterium]